MRRKKEEIGYWNSFREYHKDDMVGKFFEWLHKKRKRKNQIIKFKEVN